MKQKKIVFLLIFVICFSAIQFVEDLEECSAAVLPKFYIDDDYDSATPGWQIDHFDTIQDAINSQNCSSGDRIIVYSGEYTENLIINKSVDIFGEDSENTIINGGSSGNVITVDSANVDISTFTIKNSGSNEKNAGIIVNSDNCHIVDNIIQNCKNGIFINNSDTTTISYNTLTSNTNAIFLESSCDSNIINYNTIYSNSGNGIFLNSTCNSNIISNNDVYSNDFNGIYLHDHCNQNNISNNNVYSNKKIGIRIENSSNNKITGQNIIKTNTFYGVLIVGSNNKVKNCVIKSNSKHGIFLLADDNSTIQNNNIESNTYDGIRIQNSTDDIIKSNYIKSNSRYGVFVNYYALNNLIYNNIFEENTYNSRDISTGTNSWSTSKTSGSNIINGPYIGGNYWDDYNGTDSDSDGIGDDSYIISGSSSLDNLPLVYRLPVADAGGSYEASTGEEITFDGTGSTSPDGNITSYEWDFGDESEGTSSKPSHTYTEAGTYTVTLTVYNDLGGTDSDTTTVTVTDDTTSPIITVNQKGESGDLSNLFTFSVYVTDNVGINNVWIEYWYSGSNGKMTANMENTAGNLYKKVITTKAETDRVLCVIYANDTSDNTANTKNPYADIGGPYSDYQVLEEITFDASESYDLDGNITSYSWDFGDGTTGSGEQIKHTYYTNDDYTVELTVTDDDGNTDSDKINIDISALDSINATTTAKNNLASWSGTTLNESFYAYDTNGDDTMDTFSDGNEILSAVHEGSIDIDGENSFLISVNNNLNKVYIWNVEDNVIINVTYQTATITEDTLNKGEKQRTVKLQVKKANWTYIEVTDNYQNADILKVLRSDNSQVSEDLIWRKNDKIYILDDPSTVYKIYYEYTPPPLEDAEFTPEKGSNIGEKAYTIKISYNLAVEITNGEFYNLMTGKSINITDNIKSDSDNKNFQYTPPHDLTKGEYQLTLDVKAIDGGETSRDVAVFFFVPYIPAEEKLPVFSILAITGIIGGLAVALFIIMQKTGLNLESFVYFKNKKIIPFFKPFVFGPVRLNVDESNIKKAEFYVNGKLHDTRTEPPYSWDFDKTGIMRPKIEAKVYDNNGNESSTGEMTFYVFNNRFLM